MIKKISAILLALVLCLSVMVVPVSAAAELNGTQVAYALEWDKEYYKAGDTATLYLYLAVQDDIALYTGTLTIGLNSAFISPDDNDPASCIAGSELCESYYKPLANNTVQSTSTYQTRIEGKNTAEENETYDWYIRTSLNKNASGDHANAGNNKDGLYGSEIDPAVPFVTYTFTVAADVADGSKIPAAITSGCATCSPAQLQFKYYKTPGSATTTANIAAAQYDVSAAVAEATVGEEPCADDAHTWDNGVVADKDKPTCGAEGVRTFTCTTCKSTKTEAEPATGNHTAGEAVQENVVDASCTVAGSYESVVYCSVCDAELSRDTVPLAVLGHTAGDVVVENEVAADCANDGSYDNVVYCSVCGEEISRETVTVPANGEHVYATEVSRVDATCTTDGSVTMACGCGATETTVLQATGHTEGAAVVENEVAADCVNDGSYESVVYCSACGDELSRVTTTVPATGHTAGAAVVENEVAADCVNDGSYESVVYCSACGDELSRVTTTVPATGHDYEEVVTEPTCTDGGYTTYTCSVCGDTYTADEVEALGHTEEDVAGYAATCTENGLTDGVKCSVCDETLTSQEVIPATGHNYEETVLKTPTCTAEGRVKYTCSACGDNYTEYPAALGHTPVSVAGKEPTCDEDGYTESTVCSVCNSVVTASTKIPATGHTKENGVVTEPTYTSQGYTTYTCPECGVTFDDDYVPALELDANLVVEIREPSITTIRCRDTIVLHARMADGSEIPEGATVVWSADNENFTTNDLGDGKLEITSMNNGDTVFTVSVLDANGNELSSDTIEMQSKANIWGKIGGFFRVLFGSTLYYNY